MTQTRDQRRALFAYGAVEEAVHDSNARRDYKIVVHTLGAQITRSGLAASMAYLERNKSEGSNLLLSQLARNDSQITGLQKARDVPRKVREMELEEYMLTTRELLKLIVWLKRAIQASDAFDDERGSR